MFNWLTKNAISSVKAIRMRFSTDNINPNTPTMISPSIENYEKILDGQFLTVDKSLLIKDIIQHQTILITRPRRWGKSLTLKMLESFFQPKFSSEGDILNDDEKKEKFRKLNIRKETLAKHPFTGENKQTKIIDLQGSLPVITLTFEDISGLISEKKIITCFRNVLREGMDNHAYLLNSKKITDQSYQELLKKHFTEAKYNLTEDDMSNTLTVLIKSLKQHHNKRVILLVDEYDKLLVNIKLKNPNLFDYACSIYRNIFSIIKNKAEFVELSVFTGVNRIVNEGIFSGINNLFHDSIISSGIATENKTEHFGFTETEIGILINQAKQISKVELNEDEIKEKLSGLYNGYRIQGKLVYNPFSVMNCLYHLAYGKELAYRNYWINTGNPALLINAVKQHKKLKEISQKKLNKKTKITTQTQDKNEERRRENKIEMLFKTGEVKFKSDDGIKFEKINTSEDSLLTLMLDAGYITSADEEGVYRIPNNEVRHQFFNSLYEAWFSEDEMHLMRDAINIDEFEDPETFIKIFKKRILDYVKSEHYPEFFFQTILFACIQDTIGALEYRTNDSKKIDIVFKSPQDGTTVYIIEIKNKKTLINKGLQQIFEKKYAESIIDKYQEFTTIVLRVVYFEMELSKWNIQMAELKFTRDNLKRAIKCFVPKKNPAQTIQEVKRKEVERKKVESKEAESKEAESKEVETKEVEIIQVLNNDNLFEELKKFAISYFLTEEKKMISCVK